MSGALQAAAAHPTAGPSPDPARPSFWPTLNYLFRHWPTVRAGPSSPTQPSPEAPEAPEAQACQAGRCRQGDNLRGYVNPSLCRSSAANHVSLLCPASAIYHHIAAFPRRDETRLRTTQVWSEPSDDKEGREDSKKERNSAITSQSCNPLAQGRGYRRPPLPTCHCQLLLTTSTHDPRDASHRQPFLGRLLLTTATVQRSIVVRPTHPIAHTYPHVTNTAPLVTARVLQTLYSSLRQVTLVRQSTHSPFCRRRRRRRRRPASSPPPYLLVLLSHTKPCLPSDPSSSLASSPPSASNHRTRRFPPTNPTRPAPAPPPPLLRQHPQQHHTPSRHLPLPALGPHRATSLQRQQRLLPHRRRRGRCTLEDLGRSPSRSTRPGGAAATRAVRASARCLAPTACILAGGRPGARRSSSSSAWCGG